MIWSVTPSGVAGFQPGALSLSTITVRGRLRGNHGAARHGRRHAYSRRISSSKVGIIAPSSSEAQRDLASSGAIWCEAGRVAAAHSPRSASSAAERCPRASRTANRRSIGAAVPRIGRASGAGVAARRGSPRSAAGSAAMRASLTSSSAAVLDNAWRRPSARHSRRRRAAVAGEREELADPARAGATDTSRRRHRGTGRCRFRAWRSGVFSVATRNFAGHATGRPPPPMVMPSMKATTGLA